MGRGGQETSRAAGASAGRWWRLGRVEEEGEGVGGTWAGVSRHESEFQRNKMKWAANGLGRKDCWALIFYFPIFQTKN
jgi:hypothetical protein